MSATVGAALKKIAAAVIGNFAGATMDISEEDLENASGQGKPMQNWLNE